MEYITKAQVEFLLSRRLRDEQGVQRPEIQNLPQLQINLVSADAEDFARDDSKRDAGYRVELLVSPLPGKFDPYGYNAYAVFVLADHRGVIKSMKLNEVVEWVLRLQVQWDQVRLHINFGSVATARLNKARHAAFRLRYENESTEKYLAEKAKLQTYVDRVGFGSKAAVRPKQRMQRIDKLIATHDVITAWVSETP